MHSLNPILLTRPSRLFRQFLQQHKFGSLMQTSGHPISQPESWHLLRSKRSKTDWIWFTHNRSPALTPQRGDVTDVKTGNLSFDLREHFARSVAIVSASAIDEFLCTDLDEWLW